jgi:transcriptional activator SPT7
VLTHRQQRQSQDAKLSDPFYDSLEGLLQDLRTIMPVCVLRACRFIWVLTRVLVKDNRDAEAFLKPVSRADVPDYYDGVCWHAHMRMDARIANFIHLSHC